MRLPGLTALFLLTTACSAVLAEAGEDWHVLRTEAHQAFTFETGRGATEGTDGDSATYLRTAGYTGNCCGSVGVMERKIPLQAWRGRHIWLVVPLKTEGLARSSLGFVINKADNTDIVFPYENGAPGHDWQAHQIVLDVPDNATTLTLHVTLSISKGRATSWVDDFTLSQAQARVPVTRGGHTVPHREYVPYGSWLNSTY